MPSTSGSSPSSSATTPPIPEGAPELPAKGIFWRFGLACALLWTFGVFTFEFHPLFYSLSVLAIVVAFVAESLRSRHFDRVGWYVHRQIVTPPLPFQMKGRGQTVVFGVESIKISTLFHAEQVVAYSQIVDVYIDCQEEGLRLNGVTLILSHRCNGYSATQTILDSGSGEQTRTTLNVLRTKAPHAMRFAPDWIEQGWVPRSGFRRPLNDSDPGI